MIKDGIIQEKEIFGVPFKVDLIPKENKSSRPALPMTPTSQTIHETDNEDEGADARTHTIFVDNTRNYVSWTFTVDDSIIIQELPINENAWHAGDGPYGKGNRTSVAIEICVNKGGDFEKAKMNAIKLSVYLEMHKSELGVLWQHNHWNGKNCPRRIRKSGWDKFLNKREEFKNSLIEKEYDVPDWSLESFIWMVDNDLNDGIVQSKAELQFGKMLHDYHKKYIIPIYDKLGLPYD